MSYDYLDRTGVCWLIDIIKSTFDSKRVWYGTCSDTGLARTVSTLSGDFRLEAGNILVVTFTNKWQNVGTLQLTVDTCEMTEVPVSPRTIWEDGNTVMFVYDGSGHLISLDHTPASTSAYGITTLSDSVSGTSKSKAATENAVKTAYDLANTANTAIGNLATVASSGSYVDLSNRPTIPKQNMFYATCNGALSDVYSTFMLDGDFNNLITAISTGEFNDATIAVYFQDVCTINPSAGYGYFRFNEDGGTGYQIELGNDSNLTAPGDFDWSFTIFPGDIVYLVYFSGLGEWYAEFPVSKGVVLYENANENSTPTENFSTISLNYPLNFFKYYEIQYAVYCGDSWYCTTGKIPINKNTILSCNDLGSTYTGSPMVMSRRIDNPLNTDPDAEAGEIYLQDAYCYDFQTSEVVSYTSDIFLKPTKIIGYRADMSSVIDGTEVMY